MPAANGTSDNPADPIVRGPLQSATNPTTVGPQPTTAADAPILAQASQDIETARENITQTATRIAEIERRAKPYEDKGQTEGEDYRNLATQLDSLYRSYQQGLTNLARAQERRAQLAGDAAARGDPNTRARLQAQAEKDTADAKEADARAKDLGDSAPGKRALTVAQTAGANANAQLAAAQSGEITATTPAKIEQLQAAAKEATANAAFLTERGNTQAQETRKASSAADIAAAEAERAPRAQEAVTQKLELEVQDLQRKLAQAPTDSDARSAIQLELNTKQAALDSVKAGTGQTQAATETTKLGPLAFLQDKIHAAADALRAGQVDPQTADDYVRQYVQAAVSGTTPFDLAKAADASQQSRFNTQVEQRGQDVNLAQTRTSSLGTLAGSALGTIGDINKTAAVGSDAGAQAYGSILGNILGAYGGPQGLQAPAAVAAPPLPAILNNAAQPGTGHTITINIGGTGSEAAPPAAAPTAPTQTAPVPAVAAAAAPPDQAFVNSLWGQSDIHEGTQR